MCHYTCTGKAILCLAYTIFLVLGHLNFTKANGKHGKIDGNYVQL